MANTKISDFTSGAPAQSTDEFVIARTGANFKLAASDIKTLVVGAGSVSVASGKTLTANNTLTLAGTDSTTMTFPATSQTLAGLGTAQTFTALQTINLAGEQLALGSAGANSGVMSFAGSTSGKITLQAAAAAGTYTLTLPTSAGTNGQFLQTNGSGVLTWATGGGGSPGGSNTQLQYNNSGAFAGASGLTTDGTNLTVTSGSITMAGNISAPAWTTSGIRWKGVASTLTDTTSTGTVAAAYTNVYGGNTIAATNSTTFTDYFTSFINGPTAGTNVTFTRNWALGLNGSLQIASASELAWSTDLFLGRRNARNLRLGQADAASPLAQTLSVQSVVAGTSNTAGANLTITGSQGTGTGAGGSIIFQVAPAGSSGTAQNALVNALTINGDQTVQFASTIALGGSSGATLFKQAATNYIEAGTGFSVQASNAAGVAMMSGLFNAGPLAYYGWNNSNGISTADLRLYRDAANTLALRNGTNAQTFNVYNTFTSSTNFERFRIVAQSAAAVLIGTEKGSGGGTARALALQTDGTTRLTIETNGDLTIADAENIILGTTTGTKIGTSTSQKIGFFNKTPVVQPTAVADATDNATAITQLNALLSRMRDLGLIAT